MCVHKGTSAGDIKGNCRTFWRFHIWSKQCVGTRKDYFKKTIAAYSERSDEKRAEYDQALAQILPETPIVYLDECGVESYMARNRARAPKGERVIVSRPGKHFKRINIVAGLCDCEVIAQTQYPWTTDSRWFEVWFEWYLCPCLRPNSIIIMDNARFHRKSQLEQIAAFYGYQILWLPPYSPDKNPIEQLWANLKNWLRNWSHRYPTIQEAIRDYFK